MPRKSKADRESEICSAICDVIQGDKEETTDIRRTWREAYRPGCIAPGSAAAGPAPFSPPARPADRPSESPARSANRQTVVIANLLPAARPGAGAPAAPSTSRGTDRSPAGTGRPPWRRRRPREASSRRGGGSGTPPGPPPGEDAGALPAQPPRGMSALRASSPGHAAASPRLTQALRSTRPWVLLLAVLGFIACGLMVLGGLFFMVAGAVDHETGTRDITSLGGLADKMPVTFIGAALAALSMIGLPLTIGYFAKEEMYLGLMSGDWFSLSVLVVLFVGNAMLAGVALIVLAFRTKA